MENQADDFDFESEENDSEDKVSAKARELLERLDRGENIGIEKDWKTPPLEEIKPGLVLDIENIKIGVISRYKIMGDIREDANHFFKVPVFHVLDYDLATEKKQQVLREEFLSLELAGIIPDRGAWDATNRPLRWFSE